jgi:phage terminase large subunit-like protein
VEHLAGMREQLDRWAERVRSGMSKDEFVAACRADLLEAEDPDDPDVWEKAAPLWQSYLGLKRYWDKRAGR